MRINNAGSRSLSAPAPPATPHPRRSEAGAFRNSRRRGLKTMVVSDFPPSDTGRGSIAPAKSATNHRPPAVKIPTRLLQGGARNRGGINTISTFLYAYRQLYLFAKSQSNEQSGQIHEAFDFFPCWKRFLFAIRTGMPGKVICVLNVLFQHPLIWVG